MSEKEEPKTFPEITAETMVDTVLDIPGAMTYCIKKGVSPFSCAGDYPGSIGKLLARRKTPDPEGFIAGLNELAKSGGDPKV